MDNLLDLLMEYSKDKKRADFDFFETVRLVVTDLYDLYDEIQFTDFFDEFKCDDGENILMEYNFDDKTINVNREGLDYCYLGFYKKKLKKDNFDFFTFKEYKILFYNSFVMFALLHEIEHAKQFKLAKDGTGFEGTIFKTIFFPLMMKREDKRKKLVDKCMSVYGRRYCGTPEEKIANIRAGKAIMEILEPIISNVPAMEKFYACSIYDSYMDGYKKKGQKVISPLEGYLRDLYNNYSDDIRERYFGNDFRKMLDDERPTDLLGRMSYGLPITLMEYKYFDGFKKKDKIKTFGVRK